MIDIELSLFVFQIGRIDIGDGAVAIPLKESYIRVFRHNLIDYAEYEILYFGIAQVEYQLIAVIISFTVRIMDCPVGMCFEQITLRIHHLRFYPDTEFDTGFFRFLY